MRLFLTSFFLLLPTSLWAACTGIDQRLAMPAEDRTRIEAQVAATPFSEGNHWIARRGSRTLHVVGTMHISDPRLDAITTALAPVIAEADLLLLEGTKQEEAEMLAAIGRDPSLTLITEGPSLIDRLPPQEWESLAQKARANGVAPWMAAKMRPWFLAVSMAVPPCLRMLPDSTNGLDSRLEQAAEDAGTETRALEGPMTLFEVFNSEPLEEQVRQLRAYLALLGGEQDAFYTMVEAYFDEQSQTYFTIYEQDFLQSDVLPAGETRRIWQESMEAMLDNRNLAWIPVIEAAQGDLIVVAAGALHLPGENGVLNLLQQQGYTLERAPF
ncbi:TraB/GumN family protein [Leisingera sp. ANG-Vp]|uniref:TraB/GumN family protein n=1 Tax=Leisingera sp. ANG-Vp TaxID=1577896 RepID=UPI00057D93DF|nr:TraB/GumN family protein [Leisingera sp. ANG-Vp]KIC18837.1 polysaccharide biosynthesis protein GumN [Leisingera sp. ANG-Vp]